MSDLAQFLTELDALGISYWWRGDEIEYAPASKVTSEIAQRFVDLLPALRELCEARRREPIPAPPPPCPEFAEQVSSVPLLPPLAVPRVLFCSHDLSLTGAPLILANVIPRLRGLVPVLYSPVDGPAKQRFLDRGIPVTHDLDLAGVHLVVANTLLSAPVVAAARQVRVPCVWLIHEFHPDTCGNRGDVQAVIGYPQHVFFPHPVTATNFAPLRSRNVGVIYSCVHPVPIRDREESRRSLGLTPDDFCVVTMGQSEERKGQQDLRAAAAGMPWRVFYVCGEPDPWQYYAAADLYICTSREESFGLSLQEAKQYGLPIITTALPSCRDIIRDGVHGLHYQPGDVADLHRKIELLRTDTELRTKLSAPADHLPSFLEVVEQYENAFLDAAGCPREQPLHVVYHAAGMGENWQAIITEQLQQLRACGLTKVLATHVGGGLGWFIDEARWQGIDLTVCQHEPDVGNCEVLAMRLIERLARSSDRPILYLHTKGVSHPLAEWWWHEWRRLMMAELIAKWREHLPALAIYDAVGVNWWTEHPHFSGNFWLASAQWLRQLPLFDSYYRDRYSCERWLGSVPGCKVRSLLCHDKRFWSEDRAYLRAQPDLQTVK